MVYQFITSVFLILFLSAHCNAACPLGDALLKKAQYDKAFEQYETCLATTDDISAHFGMGMLYLSGQQNVKQDLKKALHHFRLAAENGHAPAQRELAKLMLDLENMGNIGKQALAEHEQKILLSKQLPSAQNAVITKTPLSAYAWLLLAADNPDNKWFFASSETNDDEAGKLLSTFEKKFGPAGKQIAVKQATEFKEIKLISAAREFLSDTDYQRFLKNIYSKNKRQREEAIYQLRKKIEQK